jgi:hypothetical protein
MVRRRGRYGEFWGCPGYPSCRGTVSMSGHRSGSNPSPGKARKRRPTLVPPTPTEPVVHPPTPRPIPPTVARTKASPGWKWWLGLGVAALLVISAVQGALRPAAPPVSPLSLLLRRPMCSTRVAGPSTTATRLCVQTDGSATPVVARARAHTTGASASRSFWTRHDPPIVSGPLRDSRSFKELYEVFSSHLDQVGSKVLERRSVTPPVRGGPRG